MHCCRYIAAVTILSTTCISLAAQQPIAGHGEGSAAVFVENRGQFDPAVRYKLASRTGTIWLTAAGIVFEGAPQTSMPRPELAGPAKTGVFSEAFLGANPGIVVEAAKPHPGASCVDYKDVWPGISVRLTGTGSGIEQEFILQAEANPDNIAVAYNGIDSMMLDEHGSLVIVTSLGKLREGMPQVYQEVSGRRIALPGRYRLTGLGTYGFQLDTYAPEYPLVIGPSQLTFSQSSEPAIGAPVINFFTVAPASTLPGQATIGAVSVTGATTVALNNALVNCISGVCEGTVQFYPTATTNYVLEASGAGGNVSASQEVSVGKYLKNPSPLPAGLKVTWQGACWLKNYPKSFCNGACQGMAFDVNIPTPPTTLPLEATLYIGTRTCNPSQQDNLNDLGTLTGSGGWIFWFTNHPNKENSSAIWTIGNQSSGCVSYAKAPACQ